MNNPEKTKTKQQLEQEQNHGNRDYLEGYQQGGGGGRMVEKVQEIRGINAGRK